MRIVWQTAGATLSAKQACAEYGVTEDEMRAANIPCQWRSFHGNSYAVVIRSDVKALARNKLGGQYEVTEARKALRAVNSQLAALEAQRAPLAAKKSELEEKLAALGASLEEPPKAKAGRGKKVAGAAAKAAAQPAGKRARKSRGADSDDDWRP